MASVRKIDANRRLLLVVIAVLLIGLIWNASREPGIIPAETVRVTIPEGFNVYQVASAVEEAGMVTREEFLKVAEKEEGFLFPDTYEFFKHSSAKVIVAKMKEHFEEKTRIFDEELARQGKTMRDIVIIASLLEEEAATEKDRKLISGVLWNRIKIGMPLQVDAALTYATGRSSHKLTDADLATTSPYNTYKYKGLPVGPISNPGLGAIEAALNPTPNNFIYYLSDSSGKIYFARTFDEHKLNKARHLR